MKTIVSNNQGLNSAAAPRLFMAIVWLPFAVAVAGCQSQLDPGSARAQIQIVAKPKAGLSEPFVRVSVYDAAPVRAVATGNFEHVDYANLSDIIVWLQPASTQPAQVPPSRELPVDPAEPDTRVHAASMGGVLVFRNGSARALSLYSVSDGNDFELPPIAPGATGQYMVRSEGLIEILADPAKPPIAMLYAAPSPWVARARAGQTVTFDHVPAGEYQAISWHPRLPGGTTNMTLAGGHVASTTLTLGVNALRAD